MDEKNIEEIIINELKDYNEKNNSAIKYRMAIGGEEIDVDILEKVDADAYIGSGFVIDSKFLLKPEIIKENIEEALKRIEEHRASIRE